ncbi:hypothetical protein [Ralstonia sp. ASV6]|uniref:hypothetical protein n=1 Tax=Ralstonia sp. ASV6 TaxID=2795124 RepID=UPI0018ED9082|nr:hypothetical protein [Ralstonia sp. ASV6]
MNSLVDPQKIDKIERFQTLQSGQYWRAMQTIHEEGIEVGTVLLIQSIRWVDNAPHTIILRPHPTKYGKRVTLLIPQEDGTTNEVWFEYDEHRFLLSDFLSKFEFEPDYQRIRAEEVRQVQGRINALQAELLDAQSNPSILASVVAAELGAAAAALPAPAASSDVAQPTAEERAATLAPLASGSLATAIDRGISAEGIALMKEAASREHQIATIKANWIQGKTSEIAETISAMTPFYSEQAAAALAQTEDVRTYVAKLLEGIESLDLYVGKDVDVFTIREGEHAPKDAPLTFVQRKLMLDEELAVWTDIDEWFDFAKVDLFFDAIRKHDGLINQIFPTERCVLVMATTRRYIDYGDTWVNSARNSENRNVFLLVRDGMNIHRVFSPVESHLRTARLFPSKDDQDRIFRGFDGTDIKFEDVTYTDRLADHERFALHFKRFLLLACGLDHRLKLFGEFYDGPPSLHFVSLEFQHKHCRFLHDDAGSNMLPTENRAPLAKWIEEKNSYLRSGSRVLSNWEEVMNPTTAPAACKVDNHSRRGFERRYTPREQMGTAIAYRDSKSICVDVEVSGYSYSTGHTRSFNCKVNLSKFKNGHWDYTDQPYLCLDAVHPDELYWYIRNRDTRQNHIHYIRFFKRALKLIEHERKEERGARAQMKQALLDGKITQEHECDAIIDQAVIAWRAANRGRSLPGVEGDIAGKDWKALLDQLYMLAGEGKRRIAEIEAFSLAGGRLPLRLVLSGAAKMVVYEAPRAEERDDRLESHVWVHRVQVERTKDRLIETSRRWATLPKQAAAETTVHQWEAADEWSGKESLFGTMERKSKILDQASHVMDGLKPYIHQMDEDQHKTELARWQSIRREILQGTDYVQNPALAIPFGVAYFENIGELRFLCIGSADPEALLYRLAPSDVAASDVRHEFARPYADKVHARTHMDNALAQHTNWRLLEVSISQGAWRYSPYVHHRLGVDVQPLHGCPKVNPLLGEWFANWSKRPEGRVKFWLSDDVVDESGDLILDQLIGNKLPEDYEPVDVVDIQLHSHKDEIVPAYGRWFDICKEESEEGKRLHFSDRTDKLLGARRKEFGCGSATHPMLSPGQARNFIAQRVKAEFGTGYHAVRSTEIPNAPEPPAGVERWYVIPAVPGQ